MVSDAFTGEDYFRHSDTRPESMRTSEAKPKRELGGFQLSIDPTTQILCTRCRCSSKLLPIQRQAPWLKQASRRKPVPAYPEITEGALAVPEASAACKDSVDRPAPHTKLLSSYPSLCFWRMLCSNVIFLSCLFNPFPSPFSLLWEEVRQGLTTAQASLPGSLL